MRTPTHDEIAQQAYQLWKERGRPKRQDTEIWQEASRRVSGGRSACLYTDSTKTKNPTNSVAGC